MDGAQVSALGRLIVIMLFDGVDLIDVTGPPEVFALLRRELSQETGYQVVLAAETLEPVTTSAGVRILPDATFQALSGRSIDTLLVPARSTPTSSAGCAPAPTRPWSPG